MRRLCLLALVLLLLCSTACHAEKDQTPDTEALYARVCEALGGEEAFLVADSDFAKTNLIGAPDLLAERICFGQDGAAREFGIFRVSSHRDAIALKETIRAYLLREQEALQSLAALYPAEELEARLALYRDATVGTEGDTVYYFLLDRADTERALSALKK